MHSPSNNVSPQGIFGPLPVRPGSPRIFEFGVSPPPTDASKSLGDSSESTHDAGFNIISPSEVSSGNLPAPNADISEGVFPPGQADSDPEPANQCEIFTSRDLHNVTPRVSPGPEAVFLSSPDNSLNGMSSSSVTTPLTPEQEHLQPVHSIYSNEKIPVIYGDNEYPEPVHPHQTAPPSSLSPPAITMTSSDFLPSLYSNRTPNLSPSTSLHSRRISELSDVSDKSDAPVPYDVDDEEAPPELFFRPAFQAALQQGLDIAKTAATSIGRMQGCSESGTDLNRLLKDAVGLSTFQSSRTRTIAVLGDSGEGKSSLINTLLHFPDIAKTEDIGTACTSVITEYRQKTDHHLAAITIEVEYLSTAKMEELLKEMLWNFRQLHLPHVSPDEIEAREYERMQRESNQAWCALEAAFKHRKEFKKEMLSDMAEGALEKIAERLILWTQDLEWPAGGDNGVWKSTAATAEECCEKTGIFMQDRLWPFTKIIRIYLDSHVLKTGVVLADLPGLQDTNLARVRATQEYILKCDHVFVVAKTSRAITDQSLKSSLYTVLARHIPLEWEESGSQSLQLAVVCTKSEDINHKTARREFCGPNKRIAQHVMDQLDRDIEDAKKTGKKALKKELKRKREWLFVEARNSHVTEGLQKAYASEVPGGSLNVFCVSNTTYEKYSRKGNTDMVRASGVPGLRRFCHSITAEAQLLEARHFLQSKLSSLLNSIEIWATTPVARPGIGHDKPDEAIYEVLKDVRTEVSRATLNAQKEFRASFHDLLAYVERLGDSWEKAAELKGREWLGWNWNTYAAWCAHNGNHETRNRKANWNSELMWKMRMELAIQWDLVEDEIAQVFETISKSVGHQLRIFKERARECGFASVLVEGIDFRIQDVEYKLDIAQHIFARKVKGIRGKASEPNETCYMTNEMIPAYRRAAGQRGPGMKSRQNSIVQGRITDGTLFPNIGVSISADMNKLSTKTFKKLENELRAVLDEVKNDIDIVLDSGRYERSDDYRNGEEEEKARGILAREVATLKIRHREVLNSIAALQ